MHYNKIIVSVFEWMTGETKESCVSRTETDALLVAGAPNEDISQNHLT